METFEKKKKYLLNLFRGQLCTLLLFLKPTFRALQSQKPLSSLWASHCSFYWKDIDNISPISGHFVRMINRPGVAGDVLQSPPFNGLLIHSLIKLLILFLQTFKISLNPNRESYRAELFRECSPPTTCQKSGVMCQVSCVRCQVSDVRCHVSGVTCQMSDFFFLESGGASWGSTGPTPFSLF